MKAIIPAAGFGTRMLPLTKAQPKEMLPVFNRPAMEYVVEEAINAGYREIVIVTGRTKRAIEDHFDRMPELEAFLESKGKKEEANMIRKIGEKADIYFVRQKEQLGLGHAILTAKAFVNNEDFAVLLGDDLFIPEALKHMGKDSICVQKIEGKEIEKKGVVELDGRRITRLVEKPKYKEAPSQYAIAGRYKLPFEVFRYLEKTEPGAGGEIQLTDALNALAKEHNLYAYIHKGKVFDIGNMERWFAANLYFSYKKAKWARELIKRVGKYRGKGF
ncbi:MAG: UTP--glucose-1-phosphate uridylyltransferase [Candidatus Anstonellales archaeon]